MSGHTRPRQTDFFVGSPPYDQQVRAMPGPSSRAYATGATTSAHSYSNASSVWLPTPVFAYHPMQPESSRYSELDKFGSLSIASNSLPPAHPYLSPSHGYTSQLLVNSQHQTMAVTLPSNGSRPARRTTNNSTRRVREPSVAASSQGTDPQTPDTQRAAQTPEPIVSLVQSSASAERKNPCWMCHKSFDRPSTLKKHMLVHTGERAHVCPSCDRRFGVASNLNRHMRICARKAETTSQSNAGSSNASSSVGPSAQPEGTSEQESPSSPSGAESPASSITSPTILSPPARSTTRGRKRASPPADELDTSAATHRPKRRRRAPSPSRWVPDSLLGFSLSKLTRSAPVPLPPVQPFHDPRTHTLVEERDSFDDHAPFEPYHPRDWTGRLPGPALLMQESMGIMGGRVLVF